MPRKHCEGCPCLETRHTRPFCFWYQSYQDQKDGCGNDFDEKPDKTQAQLEAEVAAMSDEEQQELLDEYFAKKEPDG